MGHLATRENPGVGAPGSQLQTKNLHPENNNSQSDVQSLLRDGGWEFASIFTGCGVAAMAAFGGGSIMEIEAALHSARLALLEAISTLKELRSASNIGGRQQ
jgi:hypothetical protein